MIKKLSTLILLLFLGSITWVSASYVIPNSGVTTAKIANQAVTQVKLAPRSGPSSTVGLGGVAVSSSSGTFTTSSASYVNVTNLSVTITTSGRPVKVFLMDDNSGGSAVSISASTINSTTLSFLRTSSIISSSLFQVIPTGTSVSAEWPPSSFEHIDFPTAGTYTYTVQVKTAQPTTTVSIFNVVLAAYEL